MQSRKDYIFHAKKCEKKFKILLSKSIKNIEEAMPLKSLFDLSEYLNPLPRYKRSKFP